MDLHAAILKEHSKAQTERIVKYVGSDKKRFAELMHHFLKGEYRVMQRAGWPLSYCVERHPELIIPFYKQIIDRLEEPGVHEAVTRNIVRLLQYADIPKRYHGRIMNSCFNLVADHQIAVASKAFALTVLEKLTVTYPEIKPEVKLLIQERWDHESAAFHSRARKILKKL